RRGPGGLGGLGREAADRVVTPVVRQPTFEQEIVDVELVDRQELHRVHAETLQVRDFFDEAQVGARRLHARRSVRCQALHVYFIDEEILEAEIGRRISLPVERVV